MSPSTKASRSISLDRGAETAPVRAVHFATYARRDVAAGATLRRVLAVACGDDADVRDRLTSALHRDWHETVRSAISRSTHVWVVWSAHAQSSLGVRAETQMAHAGGKVLVPVLLDATPLPRLLASCAVLDLKMSCEPDVGRLAFGRSPGRAFDRGRRDKSHKSPSWSALRARPPSSEAELVRRLRAVPNALAGLTGLEAADVVRRLVDCDR